MSIAAEKAAEMLALPKEDLAYLVRELLASLDHPFGDQGSFAAEWAEEIDRRSQEIEAGTVICRQVDEVVRETRASLNARPDPSGR